MDEPLPPPEEILFLTRLIHECCEIGSDTHVWREHMLRVLELTFDATLSVSYTFKFSLDPNDIGPKILVYVERGSNEAWKQYVRNGDLSSDPLTPEIMKRYRTDFTLRREDLVDDQTWYASAFYQNVRVPSDADASLLSQVAVNDPEVVDGISFARHVGQPNFTELDVLRLRFFHRELARLWNRPDPVGTHTLPPRQREVLQGIRQGESRKAIAEKMGVSANTVHSYEKALFRRAGVSGRGELLASLANVIRPNLLP